MHSPIKSILIALFVAATLSAAVTAPVAAQSGNTITAYDLIALINNLRTGNGLPALEVSPILMSTAQSTAEIMAANRMGWHIGDVRGRVMAAGYGGGATAWATENFAVGPMSIEDLAWVWSDESHMIPAVKPAYQHIGAGVATAADGSVYYVVHAAYTSGSPLARTQVPGGSTAPEPTAPAAQWVIPVALATPNADGAVIHEVKMGQSLWSIAIAYQTHIVDILRYNNLSPEQQVVWIGQKLNIPVTPQPVTPTVESTPDPSPSPRAVASIGTPLVSSAGARPTARPTRAPTAAPTPQVELARQSVTISDRSIGYALGGIFTVGVILVGFGLLSRRKVNP